MATPPKNYRDKSQSMGLWLNETNLFDFEKLDAAVRDLSESGYGIIRVVLRNTNLNHRSPAVVAAISRIVTRAHSGGVRVVLDCEPHAEPVARDLGALYPEAIGARVVLGEAALVKGRFTAHIKSPSTHACRTDFMKVEAIFLQEGETWRKLDDVSALEYRVVSEPYMNGFSTAAHSYQEGRPGHHCTYLHLSGTVPGVARGQLMIYVRFFDPCVIDFWSEKTLEYYDRVLECYRDIPLDGVGWDEPGMGGAWDNYLYGDSCARAFERLNGYRLEDEWIRMESGDCRPENLRVRLDYYRTLNEGLFAAQRRLFARAREIFGENILLGTHHTWQGEGGVNDYRSGAVDYFRLNENMDAGYTDCWWWDAKSVHYAYTLGSSLGRLTPSGEAEINTWDAKPTNARVEFQSRLMTLFDLTWFNIWYGDATDTCLYPADYTWDASVREMKRHRDDVRWLGDVKPVVEVAILHGWETVCGINRVDVANAHKTFCLNTADLLLRRSVAFDWVDTGLLEKSTVSGRNLSNALGSYSILVLPYASIMTRKAWEKCREFATAGGKLIFTGTPPEVDTSGSSLREEFAGLMGMPEFSLESYLAAVDAVYDLPRDRADCLDVHTEIEGEAPRLLISVEGCANGIQNPDGNIIYLSDLDPRERLLQALEIWLRPGVKVYSDSVLWRLYRKGSREVLVCVAKEERGLKGLVLWDGHEIELQSGTIIFLEKNGDHLTIHGNRGTALLRK